jgi:hypothetical protein
MARPSVNRRRYGLLDLLAVIAVGMTGFILGLLVMFWTSQPSANLIRKFLKSLRHSSCCPSPCYAGQFRTEPAENLFNL